jgi:hypothetical protein
MRKQKVVTGVGSVQFKRELQELFDDGWTLVPTSLVKGDGDVLLCVVEITEPETLPKTH